MHPLTREQVMAMEAGPQMDALIAEIFFGAQGQVTLSGEPAKYFPDKGLVFIVPKFSTDITAAFKVVEKTMGRFGIFSLNHSRPTIEDARVWTCQFCIDNRTQPTTRCNGKTAPLAICRASLLSTLAASGGGADDKQPVKE